MDNHKAKKLEETLKGKELFGYKIDSLINNGKSAAVFKAIKDGINYALKIFDNDLVERFGHKIQQIRIEQEIELKGHKIDNLVKIKDGGKSTILDNSYYFIVMEFIDGKNLKEFIETEKYDQEFIISTFNTLYRIAKDLLKLDNPIVHRDIKPENIMVDNNKNIILMDLGVLKFVGANSISDGEEKQFVGTLRYAPPEFLFRKEDNTIRGWNAVNLYQIGGVLHDLIQGKELFFDKFPYPNLVLAIKEDPPIINNNIYSSHLIQLTRNMLCKDWEKRNQLCSDGLIINFNTNILNGDTKLNNKIEELQSMSLNNHSVLEEIEKIRRTNKENKEIRENISKKMFPIYFKCFQFYINNNVAKGVQYSVLFNLNNDNLERNKFQISNYLFKLTGDNSIGYSKPVIFWIRTINDEKHLMQIYIVGFLLGLSVNESNLKNPNQIIENIIKDKIGTQGGNIDLIEVFNGIIDLKDTKLLQETICIIIADILKQAKIIMKPEVEENLKFQKRIAEGTHNFYTKTIISGRTVIINKI